MNTPKNKLIAVVMFGLLILVGIVVGAGIPLFSQIQQSNQSLLATHQELASLERKEELLRNLERTIEDTAPDVEKMERTFFKTSDVVDFIVALESAAASSGVKLAITNADLSKPVANQQPTSSFSLTAEGTFTQIYRYLILIENMPYNIEFSNISLLGRNTASASGALASTSNIQATINLNVLTSTE